MSAHPVEAIWPHSRLSGCSPIANFRVEQCYRIEAHRGEGTQADPHRIVTVWFTSRGELIAYEDPCAAASVGGPDETT